jgi:ferredoxin-NADP reductase
MPLKIDKVIEETHDTKTFVMVDADDGGRPFDFVAGQYLTFRFDDLADKPVVRSYTMSGSPMQTDNSIFTVKRVDGGLISNWLCDNVKEGDILKARGPIGRFVFEPEKDNEHLLMVAGGSGVTPFVSIMRQYLNTLGQEGSPKKMTLLIAYRSTNDLILWEDLKKIDATPGARVVTTLTRETKDGFWQGRPDDNMLTELFAGSYADVTVMTCGPEAMMSLVEEHCKKHGMDEQHIKTESFA